MNTQKNLFQHDRCRFWFSLRTWANPFQGFSSSARSVTIRHRSCHNHALGVHCLPLFRLAPLMGGTRNSAPSRGVDEKMCRVPAQTNAPLKIKPDGFIRPSAPRGKAWGLKSEAPQCLSPSPLIFISSIRMFFWVVCPQFST